MATKSGRNMSGRNGSGFGPWPGGYTFAEAVRVADRASRPLI
jgi:hypothetical protein